MVKRSRSRKAVRKGKKTRRAMRGGGGPTEEDVILIKDYLKYGHGHGKDDAINKVDHWLTDGKHFSSGFYHDWKYNQIQTVKSYFPNLF